MVGVNLAEDPKTVREWATKLEIPFLLLLDEKGDTPRLFGLWGHPNTVLINGEGQVVGLVRGERDWRSDAARRLVRHLVQGSR